MPVIAHINSDAPNYVTSPGGHAADRTNAELHKYLGAVPLSEAVLAQIIEAGVQVLTRASADATALGISDARRLLSEEMALVRAELTAERTSFAEAVSSSRTALDSNVRQIIAEAHSAVMNSAAAAQQFIAILPESAQQTLAPQIESFRRELSREAERVMDPRQGGAGASLHETVQRSLDAHYDRIGAKFADLELRMGVADARAEERESSSRKGFDFENDLEEVLAEHCERMGLVVRATGLETGFIKDCLKGDFVIYAEDGKTPLVCIEAKNRKSGVSRPEKNRDMDMMLRNRGCGVGLWVTKGREQNNGEILESLSATRWSVGVEEDTMDVFGALLTLAVVAARRGASTGSDGDVDTARAKIQEAITAAEDLSALQRKTQAVVKAADALNLSTVSIRTRITQALHDASDALNMQVEVPDDEGEVSSVCAESDDPTEQDEQSG